MPGGGAAVIAAAIRVREERIAQRPGVIRAWVELLEGSGCAGDCPVGLRGRGRSTGRGRKSGAELRVTPYFKFQHLIINLIGFI